MAAILSFRKCYHLIQGQNSSKYKIVHVYISLYGNKDLKQYKFTFDVPRDTVGEHHQIKRGVLYY